MKRRIIAILIFVFVVWAVLSGFANEKNDPKITETILAQFQEFTQIPRPSHHEEKISDYLKNWAEVRGYSVVQDDLYNIIFDVPATEGYEELPMVALQCHMDMVFAQAEGAGMDPLSTTIKAVNDGTFLMSDGNTSLGADDGIGMAIALCVADGKADHGPLRLIFTTCEEEMMVGALNIDPKYVSDIDYLINIDAETEGELCVSTAGSDTADITKEYEAVQKTKEKTYQIDITGLAGGHSGLDIHKNRLNAGIEMGFILNSLQQEGIDFELQSINGGSAENVIMYSSSSIICVDEADAEKLISVVNACGGKLKEKGFLTDPDAEITIVESDVESDNVLPEEEKEAVLTFLKELKNGVRTMSPDIEGLVESSANLGIIEINPEGFKAIVMSRSCNADRQEEQLEEQKELAVSLGYNIAIKHSGDYWKYKTDSKLEQIFCESYKKLFETDMKIIAVHAGLECGTFSKYNPELDMVAFGPTLTDVHSVMEKLEIASIEKVWCLLKDVLVNIK